MASLTVVCPGLRFLAASPPYVHDSLSYCLPTTWSYNDNSKNQFFATDNQFSKTNDCNMPRSDMGVLSDIGLSVITSDNETSE